MKGVKDSDGKQQFLVLSVLSGNVNAAQLFFLPAVLFCLAIGE